MTEQDPAGQDPAGQDPAGQGSPGQGSPGQGSPAQGSPAQDSPAQGSADPDQPPARLVVLAGPTAVGKGTVAAAIRAEHPDVWMSVSATTRPPRPGEVNGVHYWFVSDQEFDRMIAEDELLEWATVHQVARYGTPRKPVEEALAAGRPALLEIDLQGARQVRRALDRTPGVDALFVFLAPPSWEELVRRLVGRGTETETERERRLETARIELAAESEFDVTIVNREVRAAADDLVALMLGAPQGATIPPEDQ